MSSHALIRDFTLDDLPNVVAIAKAASDYPWSENVFRDCLKANYRLWVLEQEKPIGFLVVLDHINECELLNVAVLPPFQRQGYGRQLIEHTIAYAKGQGFLRLMLEVRASNQSAISVYHRVGFRDVGIRKNYYPTSSGREDAVLMTLTLKRPS